MPEDINRDDSSSDLDADICEDGAVDPLREHGRKPVAGQKTDEESPHLMPNVNYVYGMQHIVDNMLADVHTSMPGWDEFYASLKNLEAMLRIEERRNRFAWTLRGTRYEHHTRKLNEWSYSLYEKRWREVCTFVRKFNPLRYFSLELGMNKDTFEALMPVVLPGRCRPEFKQDKRHNKTSHSSTPAS